MSNATNQKQSAPGRVTFSLLEREYVLACPENEQEGLLEAVAWVQEKMKEVRRTSNVIGGERIAVMAALHVAYEFLAYKKEKEEYTERVDSKVRFMLQKVQAVLGTEETDQAVFAVAEEPEVSDST